MFNSSLIQCIIARLTANSLYCAIPSHLQDGDTCTVSSLMSAILIWNVDQKEVQIGDDPIIVYALNLILIYLEEDKDVNTLNENKKLEIYIQLKKYRDAFQQGHKCTRTEYMYIAGVLYGYLSKDSRLENRDSGLEEKFHINEAQKILKLQPNGLSNDDNFNKFDDIFSNDVIKSLEHGNISQVCWFNKNKAPHVFLIGRLENCKGGVDKTDDWFWYDQAGIMKDNNNPKNAFMVKASSLDKLKSKINKSNYVEDPLKYELTGVKPLSPVNNMIKGMKDIVPNGSFLAEVDYGYFPQHIGEKLYSNGFVSRHYAPFVSDDYTIDELRYHALEEAKRSADDLRNFGALIVEKPLSVFSVYKTNRVENDYNTEIVEIDPEDSEDGLLADETKFHSAWLRVNSTQGSVSEWFKVY